MITQYLFQVRGKVFRGILEACYFEGSETLNFKLFKRLNCQTWILEACYFEGSETLAIQGLLFWYFVYITTLLLAGLEKVDQYFLITQIRN